jgi:hypothetical protein
MRQPGQAVIGAREHQRRPAVPDAGLADVETGDLNDVRIVDDHRMLPELAR